MRTDMRRVGRMIGVCGLVCSVALAYTYSEFKDLDSLMERSEFIVVARIASLGQEKDENGNYYMDGLVKYEVIVIHNVRGSLPLDRHPVVLQSSFIRKYHSFRPGGMALLFLTDENSINGKKVLMNWADSGSIMPASPELEVNNLKGLPEKEQVLFILRDYVKFKKKELKELKADISKIK
jgi:hypothetical protein